MSVLQVKFHLSGWKTSRKNCLGGVCYFLCVRVQSSVAAFMYWWMSRTKVYWSRNNPSPESDCQQHGHIFSSRTSFFGYLHVCVPRKGFWDDEETGIPAIETNICVCAFYCLFTHCRSKLDSGWELYGAVERDMRPKIGFLLHNILILRLNWKRVSQRPKETKTKIIFLVF